MEVTVDQSYGSQSGSGNDPPLFAVFGSGLEIGNFKND
jgi:hypothetical protein